MPPLGKLILSSSQLTLKYGKRAITEHKDRNTAVYVFLHLNTSLLAPDNNAQLKKNIEKAVQNLDPDLKIKEMFLFGDVRLLDFGNVRRLEEKRKDFKNFFKLIKCVDRLYYCDGHSKRKKEAKEAPDAMMTFQDNLLTHANDRAGGIHLVMSGDFELVPSLNYLREEGNAIILAHPQDSNPNFRNHFVHNLF